MEVRFLPSPLIKFYIMNKVITSEFISRYFPPQDDRMVTAIFRAIEILSEFVSDTVVEETRIILKGIQEEQYEELRQVALNIYSFDVIASRKSFFDGGGAGWTPFTEYGVLFHKNFACMWNDMINEASKERRESVTAFKVLSVDIETFSSNDIAGCGVYKYAEAEDFTILLFAYSCDYGQVEIIDFASGEKLPERIYNALTDPTVLKTAFNATFERVCISKYFGLHLTSDQWECTMVRSAMLGLPLSLATVGKVLRLEDQKMDEGKALIRYFSLPCKPTKTNGMRTRNLPEHAPDKWEVFKKYCKRDVEVENAIRQKTSAFTIPPFEKELYDIDQRINDRGVMLDMEMVGNAIRMSLVYNGRLTAEAAELTGLDNPNSVAQLKAWLEQETGSEVKSLNKKDMPEVIKTADANHVKRLLSIRQELGKTSVKKYNAMAKAVCEDDRARGLTQFYGASRTGRWSGRIIQLQNLPQNHIEDLDFARSLVKRGDLDMLELCYGNVPDTLSQLIRTAIVAKPGHTFIVSDFSAIEARVIAWLAGEAWRLEVFRTHGKIYEASASMMFHVPVESITKTDPRRQKGKIAELALGYQGGVGAMKTMGGEKMGLSESEMKDIVTHWRNANPTIVSLWDEVQAAAMKAISGSDVVIRKGVRFRYELGAMTIELPSGRKLFYPRARVEMREKFGRKSKTIIYEGQNQTTKKWEDQETYGGKLVENIVQGIARDCLAVTMARLEKMKYPIVFHVHDEVILEVPDDGTKTLSEVCDVFKKTIIWAEGLPLKGDGYITNYYKKD